MEKKTRRHNGCTTAIRHYPLDQEDLDFDRYEHRPLGVRDVLAHQMMESFMFPRSSGNRSAKARAKEDRTLGLKLRLLNSMLYTKWDMFARGINDVFHIMEGVEGLTDFKQSPPLEDIALGIVRRHLFESEPSAKAFLKHITKFHKCNQPMAQILQQPKRSKPLVDHLKSYKTHTNTHQKYAVYSGGHTLPIDGPGELDFNIDPCFINHLFPGLKHDNLAPGSRLNHRYRLLIISMIMTWRDSFEGNYCLNRGRPHRTSSLPPPGTWRSAILIFGDCQKTVPFVYFPNQPISEMDKMCRRRSLSRTHIRAMFRGRPKVKQHIRREERPTAKARRTTHPCENCTSKTHTTQECESPCGHCDNDSHKANRCPVKSTNRCKCRPFPQRHLAADCKVVCRRRCGNPHSPSHNKHLNAMTCTYRCCMCGLRGHTGKECSFKRCRCGAQHLGQDCRWKVECAVPGCDRYLCGVHCVECGRKKVRGSGVKFVGGRCPDCLGNGKPVAPAVDDS